MAQHFTDFTEYTLDVQPSDWTNRGPAGYGVVREVSAERFLELTLSAQGRHLITWNAVDGDTNRADVGIYLVYRRPASSFEYSAQAMMRMDQASVNDANGYLLGPRSTTTTTEYQRAAKYINGGNYTIISDTDAVTAADVWYAVRVQAIGTALKLKKWDYGSAEPTGWDVEVTDTTHAQNGFVGLFGFNASTTHVLQFGVGTNGDPAPTGPVSAGSTGDTTDSSAANDTWSALCAASASTSSNATASDSLSVIANINTSIIAAAQASDTSGDFSATNVSLRSAATGSDSVDALASAAAALSAGAAAGESWTVQAQVVANLLQNAAANDEIRRATENAINAAISEGSVASDQFLAAISTITSLSDTASAADAFVAVVGQLASIASGAIATDQFKTSFGLAGTLDSAAQATDSFSVDFGFIGAIRSGALSSEAWYLMASMTASLSEVCTASDLMTARADVSMQVTFGAVASSSFAIVNAGIRYLVMGAITLRSALNHSVNTKPALSHSVKIKPGN